MDKGTPLGIVLGIGFMVMTILASGELSSFIDVGSISIVFGGLVAGLLISFPIPKVVDGIKAIKLAFQESNVEPQKLIVEINDLAQAARREGLLVLEEKAANMEDPFMKKGIMLMVDGTDPELIRDILETELAFMQERHQEKHDFWGAIGDGGPAWGMIGTLIGLVNMLGALSDPSTLGPKMAVALITTFYGSVLANFIAGPVGSKMKVKSAVEVLARQMMIEGLLSIQAGENPRVIEEKLKSFLDPSLRVSLDDAAATFC